MPINKKKYFWGFSFYFFISFFILVKNTVL